MPAADEQRARVQLDAERVRGRIARIELLTSFLVLSGTAASLPRVPIMEAGLFALVGVVVGGVLNGAVSWMLARASARSNARVAALLVNEELLQSMPALLGLRKERTWGWLQAAHEFGCREVWDENRAILGHALDPDAYMALAAGYAGLASAAEMATRSDPTERISDAQGESLATTFLTINRGLSYLGLLVHRPSRWHPLARRAFNRKTQKHIDGLLEKDRKYQDFMSEHGRQT